MTGRLKVMTNQQGMKTKGVAFNLADPHQKELLDWAARHPNFSNYVKRLIDRDMVENKKRA